MFVAEFVCTRLCTFTASVCVTSHVRSALGLVIISLFFFQAEDGIRYLVRSRGLGDVYKRQVLR